MIENFFGNKTRIRQTYVRKHRSHYINLLTGSKFNAGWESSGEIRSLTRFTEAICFRNGKSPSIVADAAAVVRQKLFFSPAGRPGQKPFPQTVLNLPAAGGGNGAKRIMGDSARGVAVLNQLSNSI